MISTQHSTNPNELLLFVEKNDFASAYKIISLKNEQSKPDESIKNPREYKCFLLDFAIRNNHIELISLLIKKGAELSLTNESVLTKQNVIFYLIDNKQFSILISLINKPLILTQLSYPLLIKMYEEILIKLNHEEGTDVDQLKAVVYNIIISLGCYLNDVEAVSKYIKMARENSIEINFNSFNFKNRSSLQFAKDNNNIELFFLLLENGADIYSIASENIRSNNLKNKSLVKNRESTDLNQFIYDLAQILLVSCYENHEKLVNLLFEKLKSDPNSKFILSNLSIINWDKLNTDPYSDLLNENKLNFYAIAKINTNLVKTLIKYNVVSIENKTNQQSYKNALEWACQNNRPELFLFLFEVNNHSYPNKFDYGYAFNWIYESNHVALFSALMKDINQFKVSLSLILNTLTTSRFNYEFFSYFTRKGIILPDENKCLTIALELFGVHLSENSPERYGYVMAYLLTSGQFTSGQSGIKKCCIEKLNQEEISVSSFNDKWSDSTSIIEVKRKYQFVQVYNGEKYPDTLSENTFYLTLKYDGLTYKIKPAGKDEINGKINLDVLKSLLTQEEFDKFGYSSLSIVLTKLIKQIITQENQKNETMVLESDPYLEVSDILFSMEKNYGQARNWPALYLAINDYMNAKRCLESLRSADAYYQLAKLHHNKKTPYYNVETALNYLILSMQQLNHSAIDYFTNQIITESSDIPIETVITRLLNLGPRELSQLSSYQPFIERLKTATINTQLKPFFIKFLCHTKNFLELNLLLESHAIDLLETIKILELYIHKECFFTEISLNEYLLTLYERLDKSRQEDFIDKKMELMCNLMTNYYQSHLNNPLSEDQKNTLLRWLYFLANYTHSTKGNALIAFLVDSGRSTGCNKWLDNFIITHEKLLITLCEKQFSEKAENIENDEYCFNLLKQAGTHLIDSNFLQNDSMLLAFPNRVIAKLLNICNKNIDKIAVFYLGIKDKDLAIKFSIEIKSAWIHLKSGLSIAGICESFHNYYQQKAASNQSIGTYALSVLFPQQSIALSFAADIMNKAKTTISIYEIITFIEQEAVNRKGWEEDKQFSAIIEGILKLSKQPASSPGESINQKEEFQHHQKKS